VNCYVLGLAIHPPSPNLHEFRLEEMVYHTAHAALENAGISRGQLDHITLGTCDELDGRSISSMLMAMPAGGYLVDEIKVTDSGATALCLELARLRSGEFGIGMVSSWCKSSKTDVESVMRLRGEPFYTRPIGINMTVSDALFAQAVADEYAIGSEEIDRRVHDNYRRAYNNPRGSRHEVPDQPTIASSPIDATPLRQLHRAPLTDGAVSIVMASEEWLRQHQGHIPMARLAGVGWALDSYRLERERLRAMRSARVAFANACQMAGITSPEMIDVLELESQTGYHEAAYVRALHVAAHTRVSPSGGAFAQNPLFCTGLVCAAEAILQVAGQAGAVQQSGVRCAVAHSCHGFAQQGNVFMVFNQVGGRLA
jgi:acetyl-CoA acetyltransferase